MFSFRPRLSFANAVAALALFIALGGGALAATTFVGSGGRIHGCVDKKGHLILVKAGKTCGKAKHAIAWNETGPRGPRGFRGQRGAKGDKGDACLSSDPACVGPKGDACLSSDPACVGPKGDACLSSDPACVGPKGDTGPSGASALLGRVNAVPANLPGAVFGGPSGTTTETVGPARSWQSAGNASFIARDLHAHFQTDTDPGTDVTADGMLVELADYTNNGTLDCIVSGSDCTSGTNTMTVGAGDKLALIVSVRPSATVPTVATDVVFGWRAATP